MSINHPKNKEFKEILNDIMDDNGMNERIKNQAHCCCCGHPLNRKKKKGYKYYCGACGFMMGW